MKHAGKRAVKARQLNPTAVGVLRQALDQGLQAAQAQQQQGQLEQALTTLEALYARYPLVPEVRFERAHVLLKLGRLAEASEAFRVFVEQNPEHYGGLFNYARVLEATGFYREAYDHALRAFRLAPQVELVAVLCASLAQKLKLRNECARVARSFLMRDPEHLPSLVMLAWALAGEQTTNQGILGLIRHSERDPENVQLLMLVAEAAYATSLDEVADRVLIKVLDLDPKQSYALYMRVLIAERHLRNDEAAALCLKLLQLEQSSRVYQVLHRLFNHAGRHAEAADCVEAALRAEPDSYSLQSMLIFARDHLPENTLPEASSMRKQYAVLLDRRVQHPQFVLRSPRDPERKLRVGYVSGDFRAHSACIIALSALAWHDQSRYEVHCYATDSKPEDQYTQRVRLASQSFERVSEMTDPELYQRIIDDRIDILVDMSGHSEGNRLGVFAMRAAPVQLHAWGYVNGTGLEAMDYLLTDDLHIPASDQPYYSERLFFVPTTIAMEPMDPTPPIAAPPCLQRGFITYGCLNRYFKLTPLVLDLWAALLRVVPSAHLLFKDSIFDKQSLRDEVTARFVARGVEAERLEFEGRSTRYEHIEAYNRVDIGLDPFPHGGGLTTLEALWMGVPTITRLGQRPAERISAGILHSAGLDEYIVDSWEDYVLRAAQAQEQVHRLVETRLSLRPRLLEGPLFNPKIYARQIEGAFRTMWRRYCAGTR